MFLYRGRKVALISLICCFVGATLYIVVRSDFSWPATLLVICVFCMLLIMAVTLIPTCVNCGSSRVKIDEIVETIEGQPPGVWRICKSCGKRWYGRLL